MMEFEDMQRVWNNQDEKPLYAIDEDALMKRIQSKRQTTERALNILELGILASSIISLLALLINWSDERFSWRYFPAPIILILVIGYVLLYRRRRRHAAQQFQPTVVGELEKAIDHNQFLIERIESMLWWYILPVFGSFAVFFYFEQGRYWWQTIVAMVVVGLIALAGGYWELRSFHEPQQRDLEALQELLNTEQSPAAG